MIAIILAAGKGERLQPITNTLPKCLVDVGGKEILGWQLETIGLFKFDRIKIVVGFEHQQIREYVEKNYPNLNVEFVYNSDFDTKNNSYSLQLALQGVRSNDVVYIFNADVIFHPEMLKTLVNDKSSNSAIVIRKHCTDDDMKALGSGKRITRLGKDVYSGEVVIGKALGLYKISTIKLLNVILAELDKNHYFNEAISLCSEIVPLVAIDCTHYYNVEIDTEDDLNEARDILKWGDSEWNQGARRFTPLNTNNALELLLEVKEVFSKFGVEYFFIFGLALGAYRNRKFIPWDTDLDIGCYLEDREKVFRAEVELQERGIYIPKYGNYYYDRWYIKNKEKIELHFFEQVGNYRVYDMYRCNFSFPADMINKLSNIKIYGHTFKIPSRTEKFIELSYGRDWRTPIRNQKTIQLPGGGKPPERRKTMAILGDFNPFSTEKLNIMLEIQKKCKVFVLVHTDRYLISHNKFPISLSEIERMQIYRHMRADFDSQVVDDSSDCIVDWLYKNRPDYYYNIDGDAPTTYEAEVCKKLGIKIVTNENWREELNV